MSFEVVAEGLQFPEGPVALPDGSVIVVEIRRQTLTRCWKGRTEIIAHLGGGPNGAAIGPDGAVYVCNNGGFDWVAWADRRVALPAPDYTSGRIERVDLATGRFERVYDSVGAHKLAGPNDLVFDRGGNMWFTDIGKSFERYRMHSGLYHARPDGTSIREVVYPATSYNGVGLSPDETVVYAADTTTASLFALDLAEVKPGAPPRDGATVRRVGGGAPPQRFDSLAVEADGRVNVATIGTGGISSISLDGTIEFVPFPDHAVTNICFAGADMRDAYITLSETGRLIKTRWPRPGLKLNFCPYA